MLAQDYKGYEFAAAPKVVSTKPKYKDPYGRAGYFLFRSPPSREYIPQNIMYDRRIARGSTHASMVIPAGQHPDSLLIERKN